MAGTEESRLLAGFSAGLLAVALAVSGPAGLGFLLTPIQTPLWFVVASVALPTGDILRVLRATINSFGPNGNGNGGMER